MNIWTSIRLRSEASVRLFGHLGSLASLLAVVWTLQPDLSRWGSWQTVLVLLFLALFTMTLVSEWRAFRAKRAFEVSDHQSIIAYMRGWLGKGGRAAIWTRDLSWVGDGEMKDLLLRKAKGRELIVCLPSETPLTRELASQGAEIRAYGDSSAAPASRFTIVNFGRDGARVAVGRSEGDLHVIQEFSQGEHPAFHLASDLVELARLCNEKSA